jgi:hypothetical protein
MLNKLCDCGFLFTWLVVEEDVCCYKHSNELSGFIKFGRILDQLRYY